MNIKSNKLKIFSEKIEAENLDLFLKQFKRKNRVINFNYTSGRLIIVSVPRSARIRVDFGGGFTEYSSDIKPEKVRETLDSLRERFPDYKSAIVDYPPVTNVEVIDV
jgi:hypothetical protein